MPMPAMVKSGPAPADAWQGQQQPGNPAAPPATKELMTTVLVCAGVPAMRDGLARALSSVPGVMAVETAVSSEDLLSRAPRLPDVVFLDVRLPALGGVETTRRLVTLRPDAAVVVMSLAGDRESLSPAITAGARGWLLHPVSREELCAAVAAALQPSDPRPRTPRPTTSPELTERELQVLQGMAAGMSNAQIGRKLYLSEDTIKTHARRLYRKLAVGDRAQAVASGFRMGLVH
jgi:DNA-binding NarL/FixJ family response regulator